MKPIGYDQPLYVLPFDHRASFSSRMFGFKGTLSAEQTAEISRAKEVIYDGFKAALEAPAGRAVSASEACLLVDEQFGAGILRDAAAHAYAFAVPVEKSGQDEFDFEYGDRFHEHVEAFHPTFCKVLVRYNPRGDAATNRSQASRLKRLSDSLGDRKQTLFLFELLVPATREQLARAGGDRRTYDREIRPALMVDAVRELQAAGVEPDLWKVEGLDRREDCERMVEAARAPGPGYRRDQVGCIVLGRGADEAQVRAWLTTAAGVPGYVGFAVGRTDFWEPLVAWRAKTLDRAQAVERVARRYHDFVAVFEGAR
jgi:myo-inositol catabolism protein IolC